MPAETVFGGFARSLRETAREQGREVAVTERGLDLPVDRALLQALKDPVLHALRNALSHGAEPPEARRAEIEFQFALQPTQVDALLQLLHAHGVIRERHGFGLRRAAGKPAAARPMTTALSPARTRSIMITWISAANPSCVNTSISQQPPNWRAGLTARGWHRYRPRERGRTRSILAYAMRKLQVAPRLRVVDQTDITGDASPARGARSG